MASRYWVGGTGTWDATAGTKWATTSGGAGGAAAPTANDDVFFDTNSGANIVTVAAPAVAKTLNFTGFSGTFAGSSNVTVSGSVVFAATTTYTYTGNLVINATGTITTNGKVVTFSINVTAGTVSLADDFTNSGVAFTVSGGTFNTQNFNMSVFQFSSSGTGTRTINFGSSTVTITSQNDGSSRWNLANTTNLTFNAGTSTIVLSTTSGNNGVFNSGGLQYHVVRITGAGTGRWTITGANGFNSLVIDTPPKTVWFPAGLVTTIASISANGTSGKLVTFKSATAGTPATIVKNGGGRVFMDYLSLQDIAASPADTWFAGAHSINTSGNSGWTFSSITCALSSANAPLTRGYLTFTPSGTAYVSMSLATVALSGSASILVYSGTRQVPMTGTTLVPCGGDVRLNFSGSRITSMGVASVSMTPGTSVLSFGGQRTAYMHSANLYPQTGRTRTDFSGQMDYVMTTQALTVVTSCSVNYLGFPFGKASHPGFNITTKVREVIQK